MVLLLPGPPHTSPNYPFISLGGLLLLQQRGSWEGNQVTGHLTLQAILPGKNCFFLLFLGKLTLIFQVIVS